MGCGTPALPRIIANVTGEGSGDENGRLRRGHGARNLTLTTPPPELVVYRVYAGDDLLFERRDTAEKIASLRELCEPLKAGQRATLGVGRPSDPEIAPAGPPSADELVLRHSREWHRLNQDLNRDILEFGRFQREFIVDSCATIAAEREKREADLLGQISSLRQQLNQQPQARGPIITPEGVRAVSEQLGPVVAQVLTFLKGKPSNGG